MRQEIKDYFKKNDPILYETSLKVADIELKASENYFSDLCQTIICQQLSDKVGTVLCIRFKTLFADRIITPEKLLEMSDDAIRTIGTSRSKIAFMKDLAQKTIDGDIDLKKLKDMQNEDVIKTLIQVKGIGPWTAEMFLMSSLAREDVFSLGDLGLKRAIEKLYNLDHKPSKEEMTKISDVWKPYRTYACRILWRSLAL